MGHFTGPLVTKEIGYELWEIMEEFAFHSSMGLTVSVPVGTVTDFASIPGLARSFIPKIGYWSQPAVPHDLCYRAHREGYLIVRDQMTGRLVDINKNQADLIFQEGCEAKENEYAVPLYQRRTTILYAGVLSGGLESWETPEEREERLDMINSHITDE